MDTPAPRRESVWDYPRPPRLEVAARRVRVHAPDGRALADAPAGSGLAWRVLETSHPPTYYVAPAALRTDLLAPAPGSSRCEWKGTASYLDVLPAGAGEEDGGTAAGVPRAGWTYPRPTPAFAALADAVAFYPGRVRCTLDEEVVRAQPGDFYGGWVTDELDGPFKGAPGTLGW